MFDEQVDSYTRSTALHMDLEAQAKRHRPHLRAEQVCYKAESSSAVEVEQASLAELDRLLEMVQFDPYTAHSSTHRAQV